MKHMNEDHADALYQIVTHYVQIPVEDVKMIGLDKLGMMVSTPSVPPFSVTIPGNITQVSAKLRFGEKEQTTIRIPFIRPAIERKHVREVLVSVMFKLYCRS